MSITIEMLRVMLSGSCFRVRGSRMLLLLLMGLLLNDVGGCRWMSISFMGVLSEFGSWVSSL